MSELQINTTQNVKINFTAAGVGERLLAFIIDGAIKIGYLIVLSYSFGAFEDMDQWSQIGLNTLLSLPVVFYTIVLESILDQFIDENQISVVEFNAYDVDNEILDFDYYISKHYYFFAITNQDEFSQI